MTIPRNRAALLVALGFALTVPAPSAHAVPGVWAPTWIPEANYSRTFAFPDGTVYVHWTDQTPATQVQSFLLASSDWGRTWTPRANPQFIGDVAMATKTRGFAKDIAVREQHDVFRTDDGGMTWQVVGRTPPAPKGRYTYPHYRIDAAPGGHTVAYYDSPYQQTPLCPTVGEFPKAAMVVSRDAGATWSRVTLPFYSGGLYDASWWSDQVGAIAVDEVSVPKGACWLGENVIRTTPAVWTTRDAGRTWHRAFTCALRCSAVTMATRQRIVATGMNGEVYVSEDFGRTARQVGKVGDPVWHVSPVVEQQVPVHPWDVDFGTDGRTGFLVTHEAEVYRTTDAGRTWTLDAAFEITTASWYKSVATEDGVRAVAVVPIGVWTRLDTS